MCDVVRESRWRSNLRGMWEMGGKHGRVSVLSDASRSERNQFRAGRGRCAYNN